MSKVVVTAIPTKWVAATMCLPVSSLATKLAPEMSPNLGMVMVCSNMKGVIYMTLYLIKWASVCPQFITMINTCTLHVKRPCATWSYAGLPKYCYDLFCQLYNSRAFCQSFLIMKITFYIKGRKCHLGRAADCVGEETW